MSQLSQEQKEQERVKAKQYAEMMNIAYVDPFPESNGTDDNNNSGGGTNDGELSTDQLIEQLKKKTGVPLSIELLNSLKPQPTEEDLAAEAEKRNSAILSYGLSTGKIKKEEYDAYQVAVANKKDLIKNEISNQLKEAFPELDEYSIDEKVSAYLFEHLPENDPLRISREKEILTLSDIKLKERFSNVIDLPKNYEQFEEAENIKASFEKRKQESVPAYTANVRTALQSLKHFSVEIPDTKNPANTVTVELEYGDSDLEEIQNLFLTEDQFTRAAKENLTLEQIKGEAELVLVKKHINRLISQAAKKYNAAQKEGYIQGRKGLRPAQDSIQVHDDTLKESLTDVYNEMIASS